MTIWFRDDFEDSDPLDGLRGMCWGFILGVLFWALIIGWWWIR